MDAIDRANLEYDIEPDVFGYDHSVGASDNFFYSMASFKEIDNLAKVNNLTLVDRIPHGIFKSNLILAKSIGPEKFKKFNNYISKISKERDGREFLYNFEKHITPLNENNLTHGSIIVLRKN